MQPRSSRGPQEAALPGTEYAEQQDSSNAQYRSRSTGKKEESTNNANDAKDRRFPNVGTEYIASDAQSRHTLQEDEIAGRAVALMKGTPRNSEAIPSSSEHSNELHNEGGEAEDGQREALGASGLVALSLQKVRERAAAQEEKRRLDSKKYSKVKSKVAKNVKILTATNKKQVNQKFQELLEAQQSRAASDFQQSLHVPKISDAGSSRRSPDKGSRSSNRGSAAKVKSAQPLNDSPAHVTEPPLVNVQLNQSMNAVSADRVPLAVPENGPPAPGSGIKPAESTSATKQKVIKADYVSPYKASKESRSLRRKSPTKSGPTIEQPEMTFTSPVQNSLDVPVTKSSKTPASNRPKGSYMNPTASKMLKEVSKALVSQSAFDLNIDQDGSQRLAKTSVARKRQSYGNFANATLQVGSGASPTHQRVNSTINLKSSGRPKSAVVNKARTHKKKNSIKAHPENPELADEAEVANISLGTGPVAGLGEVQTSQELLAKKYTERGQKRPTQLKEEAELMEKEFNAIMQDLEQKRSTKNMDWYAEQLNNDYASMRKNLEGSTTGSLVRKKGQNLRDQRAEAGYRAQQTIAEIQGSPAPHSPTRAFTLDKRYENLAEKKPLDFIEAVLASQPAQEN